jgi:hypothetical protein
MSNKIRGNFPDKIYGICPIGHNISPSGTSGDNISTNQIDEGEESLLHWSNYWQKYICSFCLRRVEDEIYKDTFHERDRELEKKRSDMGIVKSSDYSIVGWFNIGWFGSWFSYF